MKNKTLAIFYAISGIFILFILYRYIEHHFNIIEMKKLEQSTIIIANQSSIYSFLNKGLVYSVMFGIILYFSKAKINKNILTTTFTSFMFTLYFLTFNNDNSPYFGAIMFIFCFTIQFIFISLKSIFKYTIPEDLK